MEDDARIAYTEGQQSRRKGHQRNACPYGLEIAVSGGRVAQRRVSELCLRHWWLAGWHDEDLAASSRKKSFTRRTGDLNL